MHSKHDFLKQVWTFRGYSASNFQKSANLVNENTIVQFLVSRMLNAWNNINILYNIDGYPERPM